MTAGEADDNEEDGKGNNVCSIKTALIPRLSFL